MNFPWWKGDERTWVTAGGFSIAVEDMTPNHISNVMNSLAPLLEPKLNEHLRNCMFLRYSPNRELSDGAEQGAEEFMAHLGICQDKAVLSVAFPAIEAIVKRAKQLNIPIPEVFGNPEEWPSFDEPVDVYDDP